MNLTIATFNVENLFNRYAIFDQPWDGRSYEKVVPAYNVASIAILPHKSLVLASPPVVTRNGLTTKCKQYTGPQFATIGPEHTEASDHCPLSVTFSV